MNIVEMNPEYDFSKLEDFLEKSEVNRLKLDAFVFPQVESVEEGLKSIMNARCTKISLFPNGSRYCGIYYLSSISDLYKLTKFYLPETSLIQIYDSLINIVNKKEGVSWICSDVRKRVWRYSPSAYPSSNGFSSAPYDEYMVKFVDLAPADPGCYGMTNDIRNLSIIKL